jgi:nicotinamide mononucleotide transporter
MALLGAVFTTAAWQRWVPYPLTETLGFVTGAACVYLVVKENIWNFPLGLANNLFFLVLFFKARLYADAGLQVVYLALGVQGWHWWLHGGSDRSPRRVERAPRAVLLGLGGFLAVGTVGLTLLLRSVRDSAPFLDALTTALSLGGQYLLNRKAIENWCFWIAADLLYIYLYLQRGLQLTALLYLVFLGLCVAGLIQWRRSLRATSSPAGTAG